jgi:hypothetical protein
MFGPSPSNHRCRPKRAGSVAPRLNQSHHPASAVPPYPDRPGPRSAEAESAGRQRFRAKHGRRLGEGLRRAEGGILHFPRCRMRGRSSWGFPRDQEPDGAGEIESAPASIPGPGPGRSNPAPWVFPGRSHSVLPANRKVARCGHRPRLGGICGGRRLSFPATADDLPGEGVGTPGRACGPVELQGFLLTSLLRELKNQDLKGPLTWVDTIRNNGLWWCTPKGQAVDTPQNRSGSVRIDGSEMKGWTAPGS